MDAVVPVYLLGLGQPQMHLLHGCPERALERWGDGYSASHHVWNSPLQPQIHKNPSVFQEWCSVRHSQWSSQCSCPGDGFKELQGGTARKRTSINPSLSCWHFLNLRDTQEHRWPLNPDKTISKWVCNLLDACTPSRPSIGPLASHELPLQPFSILLSFLNSQGYMGTQMTLPVLPHPTAFQVLVTLVFYLRNPSGQGQVKNNCLCSPQPTSHMKFIAPA